MTCRRLTVTRVDDGTAGRTSRRPGHTAPMRLIPVLLIAGLLAGCGGGAEEVATPVATQSDADAKAEVRAAFDAYNAALLERDFPGACEHLAPETTAKLQAKVKEAGMSNAPEECELLLGAIYQSTDQDPKRKKLLDEVAKTAKVNDITVAGDTAVIDWTATLQGEKTPVTQSARRIDGEWMLVDVTN